MTTASCRCGCPAIEICGLCKAPLCGWHAGTKAIEPTVRLVERAKIICFPNCTSSFGAPEEPRRSPPSRA